jgi:benzoate-CoA ligase family protein
LIVRLAYNAALMTTQSDSNNLLEYFLGDEKLKRFGERQAIEFRGQPITYIELRQAVDFCVKALQELGVKSGDRVALLLYDSPDFIAYYLATVYLGGISVPINTFLKTVEITFILADSGAKLLIAEAELAAHLDLQGSDNVSKELLSILLVQLNGDGKGVGIKGLREVSNGQIIGAHNPAPIGTIEGDSSALSANLGNPEIEAKPTNLSNQLEVSNLDNVPYRDESNHPENIESQKGGKIPLGPLTPAILLYTSGSTGTPKGALHSQGNVLATIEGFGSDVLKLQADDRVFSASRLYFAYGLGNSLSFPIAAGATVILEDRRPVPKLIAEIFQSQRPTVFFAVPAVFGALLDLHKSGECLDISSIRLCISAGEALPASIFSEWLETFGIAILDGIGSTEMLHMFISNRAGNAIAGSSGTPVKGYMAEILDDSGKPIVPGGQGNLWIKGPSAMLGYWKRDDLTAKVMRQGFMKTGDIYRLDEQGFYYHMGRSDDCFKVKGLWVSPVEIESILLSHGEVIEAAVVASTDDLGLATAKAYLVIRKGSETLKQELYEYASARLAPYKTPTQYEIVDEMPRTSTGKIQRFKLRS